MLYVCMCIINFSPSRVKSKHHHQTKVQREKKNYFSKIPLSNSSLLHSQNNNNNKNKKTKKTKNKKKNKKQKKKQKNKRKKRKESSLFKLLY